ncbi:PAS domain-containing sensor histidine kinase [Xylophilus sp. Kf1]|nr:PAS domain-containing sensor histidine kinase [Xylophilus sp. Kf1]
MQHGDRPFSAGKGSLKPMQDGSPANPMAPSAAMAVCGMATTDAKGRLLWVNDIFCRWLGVSGESLVGHRKLQDLLTIGGRIFHQTHWLPLIQLQGSVAEVKLDFVCADGVVVPMVLNAEQRERAGMKVHDIAIFVARDRDIYERELLASRARLQVLVADALKQEEAAQDRALYAEQMVGIVSHDLRNPLSAVHIGVQALQRTGPDERQQRMLDRVARSVDRANRLIADLLDFTVARLGAGIPIAPASFDLHALGAEVVADLAPSFSGQALGHRGSGDATVVADADRLAQVIGNLVGNAMVYGEPGRAVTVSTRVDAEGAHVAVHNHGTPIAPEAMAGLFAPMVRGVTGGADRSVGLGLYIVGQIAKAHGGRVSVSSTAESGTTFTVSLPVAQPA